MKAELMMSVSAAAVAAQTVPTVYVPLNLRYGPNEKVSTDVHIPSVNETIPVVYDQGSENFFIFGPNSIANWGRTCLGCQGPCNASVPEGDFYDYSASSTASKPVPFKASFIYGGVDKIYTSEVAVNETLQFTNVGGQSDTTSNTQVAITDYLQQRLGAEPDCKPVPVYDLGILGISPYYHGDSRNTTGPSFRQNLLEQGTISAPVQALWFDEPPANATDTYTGGGLQGGIDTSKFTGPLVKVPNVWQPGDVGYYVPVPKVSVNGVPVATSDSTTRCLIDSGTHNDDLPIAARDLLYNLTGITTSPAGHVSWHGSCDSIPKEKNIEYTFAGVNASESVTVKVPIRAYARFSIPSDEADGYCSLSFDTSGCVLGGPFATAAFFAADDERNEVAFAQGGVSKYGSGVDKADVVARIP